MKDGLGIPAFRFVLAEIPEQLLHHAGDAGHHGVDLRQLVLVESRERLHDLFFGLAGMVEAGEFGHLALFAQPRENDAEIVKIFPMNLLAKNVASPFL